MTVPKLSPEREGLITASAAPLIVHGSGAQRYAEWMVRTHQAPPEDLSDVFPVHWGRHNEAFCLDWTARKTQHPITERGRFVRHPTLPFGATLDGYREHDDAVVECKVLSPFSAAETVGGALGFREYYRPQAVLQMHCRPAARGWLCVQQGNSAPQLFEVERDEVYEAGVLDVLLQFHQYVVNRTPPAPAPPAPVPADRWRQVDLSAAELPNWAYPMAAHLEAWSATRSVAAEHEQTKKDVKLLLPDDVGLVVHGAIRVKRARNGAVTISETT